MREVEPIHAGYIDQVLNLIRHLFRPARHLGPQPAEAEKFHNPPLRPREVLRPRNGVCEAAHNGLDPRAVAEAKVVVVAVAREVDAGPPAHERERALGICVLQIAPTLRLGLLVRGGHDDGETRNDLDVGGIPAVPGRLGADIRHRLAQLRRVVAADEDGLAVLAAKRVARVRDARLEQEWRPLRGGLAEVRAGHVKVPADVVDLPDSVAGNVHTIVHVLDHGVVAEAAL